MGKKFERFEEEYKEELFDLAERVRNRRIELIRKERDLTVAFMGLVEQFVRSAMREVPAEEHNVRRLLRDIQNRAGIPKRERRKIYDRHDEETRKRAGFAEGDRERVRQG